MCERPQQAQDNFCFKQALAVHPFLDLDGARIVVRALMLVVSSLLFPLLDDGTCKHSGGERWY